MRRPALVLVALLLAMAATGCVGLPSSGPVRSVAVQDNGGSDTLVDYTPPGPTPGSAPIPLVDDFLTSMTATPLNTYVARQYLTAGSSRSWVPEQGTVVYGSQQMVSEPGGRVTLELRDVVELDGRGTWLGDPTGGKGRNYRLHLVREGGEWRLNRPPDRLLIPRTHFDTQYQQRLLYFFDQSAQVLVPEPVYVPRGRQAPTLLLASLLQGPEPDLRRTERTFFPRGTRLDGISVPVSRNGTAEVPLSDHVLDAGNTAEKLLFAQIAWTLGQLPGVQRVRVTVGGTPVDPPGLREDVGVDDLSEFDPSVAWASTALFGLRDGRVVTSSTTGEERVTGPAGTLRLGLRSLAVDLLAQHIAGVGSDGRRVLESDRDGVPGRPARRSDVRTVYRGTDVLRPAYDLYGRLWLVDDTRTGARLSVVRAGTARPVVAPGVTGAQVDRVTLSRDGTRLVTQVHRDGHDRVLVSRVERDTRGRVTRVGPAHPLPLRGAAGPIVDVAWQGPATLAVLLRQGPTTSQVLLVKVDGSSTPTSLEADAELFDGRATGLVASPAPGTPLLLRTADGRLLGLSRTGRWARTAIEPGLGAATFVG